MSEFMLLKMEICGFRGFTIPQVIAFGNPLTLIYGQNRNGKSSITNALEWCLFGPEVGAIQYGIRERDGWEVKNLNSATCHVQCDFKTHDGDTLTVKRTYRTTRTSDLSYETAGGVKSTDEKKLHALLQISSSDFISSVHLHPEIIRNLVIAKPKERKEAIDRLLGLSDLRDMVEAFASEKPSGWTATLDQELTVLDEKLTTALTEKKKAIDNESAELRSKGVQGSDMTADGALKYAVKVLGDLRQFTTLYHLTSPPISAPADFGSLRQFRGELPTAIQKLRSEHPVLSDQGEYLIRKNMLEGMRTNYNSQKKNVADAESASACYPDKRSLGELADALSPIEIVLKQVDAEIREVSQNAKILDEALIFFQNRLASEQLTCPICGETSRTIGQWHDHIQKEIAAKSLQPLLTRKEESRKKKADLETAVRDKRELQKKISDEKSRQAVNVKNIETALAKPISETDDAAAILNTEISAIDQSLAAMQQQVESINLSFNYFQEALLDLDRFQRIGKAQQEMTGIEAINESNEYKELRKLRKEAEQYAEDVELLIRGLKAAVDTEAQKRLTTVQDSISDTFTKLTNRADFPGLKISASSDGYIIELTKDLAKTKAVSILNHADINCSALSIFLALAGNAQISHRLGIVILDDSSQSLDVVCKKNLCTVLTGICDSRQVIVATADNELRDEVREMHKNKMCYAVKQWTPKGGPQIEAETASSSNAV